MIESAFRGVGRVALWGAKMAFITGASLLFFGSMLVAYPVLRRNARDKRVRASMDFATSSLTLIAAFSDDSMRKFMEQYDQDDA